MLTIKFALTDFSMGTPIATIHGRNSKTGLMDNGAWDYPQTRMATLAVAMGIYVGDWSLRVSTAEPTEAVKPWPIMPVNYVVELEHRHSLGDQAQEFNSSLTVWGR